ncbi:MAG: ribosome small subunit-dependent GTPase A [Candidatus Delongbacteria bacterium]|nr:ribosome small subunit-dependent GTPase A [Candidatus Delongbacteria bacterium]MBN2835980.1 ribosome small subunit-dependent GTPase A [Candidatus Delongbacteria bacterium]
MTTLKNYGWDDFFEVNFKNNGYLEFGYQPARITKETKNLYFIMTKDGEAKAINSNKFFLSTFSRDQLPVVGDWVVVHKPVNNENYFIEGVLERRTRLVRKGKDTFGRNFVKAGDSSVSVISANIDTVFYVASLDYRDFNLSKIERYILMLHDSGAKPVLILNKKDICPDYLDYIEKLKKISGDIPIHAVSAVDFDGIEELLDYISEGKTVSFIGSSGVGKSSIVNALMGEDKMYVSRIREADKRGRHTTTHREMILFPEGGVLIDNPGIRDLKPVSSSDALDATFEDITDLESQCRFSDCKHNNEPGCAIIKALESGELSVKRYENYLTLKREADFFERRAKMREHFLEKAAVNEKKGGKKIKNHMKGRKKRDKYFDSTEYSL